MHKCIRGPWSTTQREPEINQTSNKAKLQGTNNSEAVIMFVTTAY